MTAGSVGLGLVALGLSSFGAEPSGWMLLPVVALALDFISGAWAEQRRLAIVAYGHTALIAGLLALGAFQLESGSIARSLTLIGPSLAAASAPLVLRIWAATVSARSMIDYVAERRELLRSALAHAGEARVVRIERVAGDEVELVTVGSGDELRLLARASLLGSAPLIRQGQCFLLEKPVFGELDSIDGYRDAVRARRLQETGERHWVSRDPEGWMQLDYASEVRAGVVVMLIHHAAVCGAALGLARST